MLTGLDIRQVNSQDLEIVSVRSSNQLPGMVIEHFFFLLFRWQYVTLKKVGKTDLINGSTALGRQWQSDRQIKQVLFFSSYHFSISCNSSV